MNNTTEILRGLLEKAQVEVDLNLDRGSFETEDTNFYLYAVVACLESVYDLDITFAKKTSQDVSHETLDILPLTEDQKREVAHFILSEMDEQEINNHLYI